VCVCVCVVGLRALGLGVDAQRMPGSCEFQNLGLVVGFRGSGLVFMA